MSLGLQSVVLGGRVEQGDVTLDFAPVQSHLAMGGELGDYFSTFGIKTWIHLHSCLST